MQVEFKENVDLNTVGRIEIRVSNGKPISGKIWKFDDSVEAVIPISFNKDSFELLEKRFSGVEVYVADLEQQEKVAA